MVLKVTQEHINRGQRCSPSNCPIALALKEIIKGNICVQGDRIYFTCGFNFEPSFQMKQFIHNFDHGDTVEPTRFEIINPTCDCINNE